MDLHNKREIGKKAVCDIGRDNLYATFRVEYGKLIIRCEHGSLTKEQESIANKYKEEIIEYLITPPPSGICTRHITMDMYGKFSQEIAPIEWTCTQYGVWVCMCYFKRQLVGFKEQEKIKQHSEIVRSKTATYWQDIEKRAV